MLLSVATAILRTSPLRSCWFALLVRLRVGPALPPAIDTFERRDTFVVKEHELVSE